MEIAGGGGRLDRFLCMQAFVRVAESQSFSTAARQLGVTGSVITSRIKQLEGFVQAPLFHRSTRKVVLSEAGQNFFNECAELIAGLELLMDRMRLAQSTPSGTLRIQVLPGFALGHLGKALKEFSTQYPHITLDITVSDKSINPVEEGYDIALQIFRPRAENLIERSLFPVRRVFCASPQYLRHRAAPRSPQDLPAHEMALYSGYPTRNRWVFRRGKEEVIIDLPANLRTNSVHLLHDFVLTGAGITCLPTLVCGDDLATGALVALLPDYELHPPLELLAIYPPTHRRALKVQLLVDFVRQRFKEGPAWDRTLASSSARIATT